ncbi:MAG: 3-deoxy-D-manno-octulosonic acid transferase [Bacteroidetes bacterium]|nr:MAG: 3-deoxy-D-manno-octulosonic acid transferase [Bacteroidota bacterium]
MPTPILRIFYQIGIYTYGLLLRLAAFFHPKARRWVQGRRQWESRLRQALGPQTAPLIWMHCASLGEFEQGRNLIDALHGRPEAPRVLVTFFSPSGYEVRKTYPRAAHVAYLPLDTPRQVRHFLDLVQPKLLVLVKYELWLNYLRALHRRDIPVVLLSARMDRRSRFLRSPLAPLYQQALGRMAHVFTQDEATARLLGPWVPSERLTISGDTRYDRVCSNRDHFSPVPGVEEFKGKRLCLVGGSTWPRGESLLLQAYKRLRERYDLCLIMAPHEIDARRLAAAVAQAPGTHILYSQLDQLRPSHDILWVDNVGMLARLYHYADVAYVGGGWGTGLHNILEAAVFGCPVLFGPQHERFPEAAELIAAGGGRDFHDLDSLVEALDCYFSQTSLRAQITQINRAFVEKRSGATAKVLAWGEDAGYW